MPRIRCYYDDCIFLNKGICIAPSVEFDPDDGCLSYSDEPDPFANDTLLDEEDDIYEDESWEEEGFQELEDLDFSEDEDF